MMPGLPEKSGKDPNFQTETIKGLVIIFYKNLLMGGPKQYTTAYAICWALAKRYNETAHIDRLEELYKKTTIGYPLGLLQTIVFRDINLGRNTNRIYNYGYQSKPISLGDMILSLDTSLAEILNIFTEICVKYDIDTAFTAPIIEGLDLTKQGEI